MRAVNLIPEEQRSGGAIGSRSGGAAFLVLGLLAGMAVLAGLYGMAHHKLESGRSEAARLTAEAQQVQAQAASLTPYTSFMAIREQRMQAVAQLVASRFDWSNALGEFSRVLPQGVALSAIQGTIGTATGATKTLAEAAAGAHAGEVASATPPGTTPTVTLTGCATSQSAVAQTLVRLRLISGVSTVTLASSTKAGGGNGQCGENNTVFNVQVNFSPLPSASETSAALVPAESGSPAGAAGPASDRGSTSSTASYTSSGGAAR